MALTPLKELLEDISAPFCFAASEKPGREHKLQRERDCFSIFRDSQDRLTGPLCYFSAAPRLTLRQAFHASARHLPADAKLAFYKPLERDYNAGVIIQPLPQYQNAHGEPLLSWRFNRQGGCVRIGRIHAGNHKGKGLGSLLLLSQLPLWDFMGARYLAVDAHEGSKSWYEMLGFRREQGGSDSGKTLLIPMRLDFSDREQADIFVKSLARGIKKQENLPAADPSRLALPGLILRGA